MFTQFGSRPLVWRRVALIGLAVLLAFSTTLTLAILFVDLPRREVLQLGLLLVASTVISLGVGGLFIWWSSGRRWGRFANRLFAVHAVGLAVIVVSVLGASLALFDSSHDRSLLILLLAYSIAMTAIYAIAAGSAMASSMQSLAAAGRRLATGELTVRAPIPPEGELAEIGDAVNSLADRLDEASRRQRSLEETRRGLISVLSHDLKTPLGMLSELIGSIDNSVAHDPAALQRHLTAMERETATLGRLIDELAELANLDAGQFTLRLQTTSISPIVQAAMDSLRAESLRWGVALRAIQNPMIAPVVADPERIQRVLYNLIENAIRHTPPNGSIFVEVYDRGPEIQVSVRDTGQGIPIADLPNVFDRFYRGDAARSRDGFTGAGLGLTIARRLVEIHHGRIWVAQPPEGGSIFSFTLPKAPTHH